MIYHDSFVPDEGKALIDYVSSDVRKMYDARKDANMPLASLRFETFGLSDPKIIDFVKPRLTDQPWRTFYQPVEALRSNPTPSDPRGSAPRCEPAKSVGLSI
jgi:hypothetical protein